MRALWLNQYTYRLPDWLIDSSCAWILNKLCGRPPQYAPAPASWPLTFDLESGARVTYDVGPDVRDRQTSDVRRASSLNAPAVGAGHNKRASVYHHFNHQFVVLARQTINDVPLQLTTLFPMSKSQNIIRYHRSRWFLYYNVVCCDFRVEDIFYNSYRATDRGKCCLRDATECARSAPWCPVSSSYTNNWTVLAEDLAASSPRRDISFCTMTIKLSRFLYATS